MNAGLPCGLGRVFEVLGVFLKLGLTSFGGPVAHLGFFREECVARRGWLSDAAYADLVALCQFLPGPASSQVGFAIGYQRAGLPGAFAAWVGFTLPSAVLMIACAWGVKLISPDSGWLHGLKIAAVAVVAQAVWIMGRKLCPDIPRRLLAAAAAVAALLVSTSWMQLAVIIAGLALGALLPHTSPQAPKHPLRAPGTRLSAVCLAVFALLLAGLPLLAGGPNSWLNLADAFYRTGALVFGGGHVVLPLLETETVARGWLSRDDFLAGYGAAQALPGPLFSFAAYLGALIARPGWLTGIWCLVAIYLPSFLLVLGTLPHWQRLRARPSAQGALAGANAAVVGLLLAALVHPVGTSAVTGWPSAALAVAAFAVLQFGIIAPWQLVLACALAGGLLLKG